MGPELRFSPVQILSLRPYNNEKSWNDVSDIVQLAQVKHDQKHKKTSELHPERKIPCNFFLNENTRLTCNFSTDFDMRLFVMHFWESPMARKLQPFQAFKSCFWLSNLMTSKGQARGYGHITSFGCRSHGAKTSNLNNSQMAQYFWKLFSACENLGYLWLFAVGFMIIHQIVFNWEQFEKKGHNGPGKIMAPFGQRQKVSVMSLSISSPLACPWTSKPLQ